MVQCDLWIEFILVWEQNASVTLFVKIDLVLKPDPYVRPDILSVQTLDTLYHISSLLSFTGTRSRDIMLK